jgi:hypothetical protein
MLKKLMLMGISALILSSFTSKERIQEKAKTTTFICLSAPILREQVKVSTFTDSIQ